MSRVLRVQIKNVREQIQQLRAWRRRWIALQEAHERTARALSEVVRAVPGQRFESAAAMFGAHMRRVDEHTELLARTLEQALDRLEIAFRQAANALQHQVVPLLLPTTPLAVGADGRPLSDQFAISFPPPPDAAASSAIRWTAACGPVALSMVLSKLTGRPIPAQEVATQLVHEVWIKRNKNPDVYQRISEGAREVGFYTDPQDLTQTAALYQVRGQTVFLDFKASPDQADKAWNELRGLVNQPGAVIALVTAKQRTSGSSRQELWNYNGLSAADVIPDPNQRKKGDGGLLTGNHQPGKNEVAHWVVVDRLEEQGGHRYVIVNNPFKNRQERYPWEYFRNSINTQAIAKDRWWVLHFQPSQLEIQRSTKGPSPE